MDNQKKELEANLFLSCCYWWRGGDWSWSRQLYGFCEICCSSELPSSFLNLRYCTKCRGGGETHTGCFCCLTLAVTHQQAKRNRTTTLLSCTTPKLASHWRGTASKAQAPKRHLHAAKSSRLQLNQKHLKSSNSTRHLKNYFLLTCSGKVLCYSHVLTWETRRRQNHISNSTWPILQCYICRVSLYSLSKAALP